MFHQKQKIRFCKTRIVWRDERPAENQTTRNGDNKGESNSFDQAAAANRRITDAFSKLRELQILSNKKTEGKEIEEKLKKYTVDYENIPMQDIEKLTALENKIYKEMKVFLEDGFH